MTLSRYGLLLALLVVVQGHAMDLAVVEKDDSLVIYLDNINYPADLIDDLKSGLTTNLLVQVEFQPHNRNRESHHTSRSISVYYDLWDEVFFVQTNNSDDRTTYKDITEVVALLSKLKVVSPKLSIHQPGNAYNIFVRMLLNPIDSERIALIRKFVAENSVPGGGPTTNVESGDNSMEKSKLFSLIFERYIEGAELRAIWTESASISWPPE